MADDEEADVPLEEPQPPLPEQPPPSPAADKKVKKINSVVN